MTETPAELVEQSIDVAVPWRSRRRGRRRVALVPANANPASLRCPMLDLHVLGTASARPTTKRAVSGSVLACPEGLVIIDPGEGSRTGSPSHVVT